MDNSEISILDSIGFFEKKCRFQITNDFYVYKVLKWCMRAMVRIAWVTSIISVFQWFIRVSAYNPIWPS